MKISQTPTNFIAVKAFAGNEYDCIDLAIIELNDQFILNVKKCSEVAKNLQASGGMFYSISFWHYAADFYVKDEDLYDDEEHGKDFEELIAGLEDDNIWTFIKEPMLKEDGIPYGCIAPEDKIRDGIIKYKDDSFSFQYQGRWGGGEYWTEEIAYNDLFVALNATQQPA